MAQDVRASSDIVLFVLMPHSAEMCDERWDSLLNPTWASSVDFRRRCSIISMNLDVIDWDLSYFRAP